MPAVDRDAHQPIITPYVSSFVPRVQENRKVARAAWAAAQAAPGDVDVRRLAHLLVAADPDLSALPEDDSDVLQVRAGRGAVDEEATAAGSRRRSTGCRLRGADASAPPIHK